VKHGLDRRPLPEKRDATAVPPHANIRGPKYSHSPRSICRLRHPTLDTLQALPLTGRSHALCEHRALPERAALSFEERRGLLVDREGTERSARRLPTRLRQAKLRQNACLADLEYRAPRGLDKALLTSLATCQWVRERRNVLITGPTGQAKPSPFNYPSDRACVLRAHGLCP
jgi:hypothetical protein